MPNEIKDKYSSSAALTITLASLANLTGRQSTLVDNATTKYQDLLIYVKIKMGGSAADANSIFEVFLLRSDKDATTEHVSDGAGASDAALTPLNAEPIGVIKAKSTPAANDVMYGEFLVQRPGPKWGIAVFNRMGQTLDSTGSNHWARYIGLNPDIQ